MIIINNTVPDSSVTIKKQYFLQLSDWYNCLITVSETDNSEINGNEL